MKVAPDPVAETIPGFTYDAPVPEEWLWWIVTGMGVIFLWHSFRQAKVARRRWLIPILWLLRMAAVVALATMVAGPSDTQTVRQTQRQSVTILVDTSGSMSRQEAPAHTAEWERAGPNDVVAGSLTAAQFHLQALHHLPTPQLASRLGLEHTRNAIHALTEVLPKLEESTAANLRPHLQLLTALATELAAERSVVLQEARRSVTEALTAVRMLTAKLVTFPASPATAMLTDETTGVRRLARVADWLDDAGNTWLGECRNTFDVNLIEVGSTALAIAPENFPQWRSRAMGDGPQSTDLAAMLDEGGRSATLGHSRAVVFVSDGAHNAAHPAAEAAARLRGLPVVWVPIGARLEQEQKDLMLAQVTAPRSVFRNATIEIEPRFNAVGSDGETVEVTLRENDRELERQSVQITNGVGAQPVLFHWKPSGLGEFKLTVEATPLKGEKFLENNHQTFPIEVLDDTLRILVADHEPRWETRYLLNLLKRDARLSFNTVLASPLWSPTGQSVATPTLPLTVDAWAQHRIIILGDLRPEMLSPGRQETLALAVLQKGCTLLVIAGSESMPAAFAGQPLEAILPVKPMNFSGTPEFSVSLATAGKTMPVMQLDETVEATAALWQRTTKTLPLTDLSPWSVAKPQATVLLQAVPSEASGDAEPRAWLSFQDAGKGRVIFLAAPATWHLRYAEGDTYHFRFWSQLIHWAISREMETGSRSVQLGLERPSPTVPQDAPVVVTLKLEDLVGTPVSGATSQAIVMHQGTTIRSAPFSEDAARPGYYTANFPSLPVGALTLTAQGEEISALLKRENRQGSVELALKVTPADNREQSEVLCNFPELRRLAAASDGTLLPPHAIPSFLQNLNLLPTVTETTTRTPLWNEWHWLALVLCLLVLEWALRRVAGVL